MEQSFQDVITYEPLDYKTIDPEEYAIFDPNVHFFFFILNFKDTSHSSVTERYLQIAEKKRQKPFQKKRADRIAKVVISNLKELKEVNILKSLEDGEISFDSTYWQIIDIVNQTPTTFTSLRNQLNQQREGEELTVEELIHFLGTLEDADYIRKSIKIVMDKNYQRILDLLRNSPLTVKELEKEFNFEQSEKNTKSENTIYRYLKTLESAKLVTPAGQRVVIGKTATETIFSTTAKIFFTPQVSPKVWKTHHGMKILEVMEAILKEILPDKSPTVHQIAEVLDSISNNINSNKEDIVSKISESIVDNLKSYSIHEINVGFHNSAMLFWFLNNPDVLKSLLKQWNSG